MSVLYERLSDFCFCCAHIGHQYWECLKYIGQPKQELPYVDGWEQLHRLEEWSKIEPKRDLIGIKVNQEQRLQKSISLEQTKFNTTQII